MFGGYTSTGQLIPRPSSTQGTSQKLCWKLTSWAIDGGEVETGATGSTSLTRREHCDLLACDVVTKAPAKGQSILANKQTADSID
jgi:hypothetical protein